MNSVTVTKLAARYNELFETLSEKLNTYDDPFAVHVSTLLSSRNNALLRAVVDTYPHASTNVRDDAHTRRLARIRELPTRDDYHALSTEQQRVLLLQSVKDVMNGARTQLHAIARATNLESLTLLDEHDAFMIQLEAALGADTVTVTQREHMLAAALDVFDTAVRYTVTDDKLRTRMCLTIHMCRLRLASLRASASGPLGDKTYKRLSAVRDSLDTLTLTPLRSYRRGINSAFNRFAKYDDRANTLITLIDEHATSIERESCATDVYTGRQICTSVETRRVDNAVILSVAHVTTILHTLCNECTLIAYHQRYEESQLSDIDVLMHVCRLSIQQLATPAILDDYALRALIDRLSQLKVTSGRHTNALNPHAAALNAIA